MSKQLFLNNFEWTFIANVKSTPSTGTPDTELGYGILQIGSAASAFLVNPTGGDWYVLTALKRSGSVESQYEIIKVLGVDEAGYVAGGECRIRVTRAQEGTTAQAYVSGDFIALRLTKGGAAGFMQATDNLTGIADASVARTNLGLGTAATTNTGTGATNTILGNDARLTDSRAPNGAAGGVLAGTFPSPSFAADMATQAELDAHAALNNNPHSVTKTQVGLGSVDNTADADKPVSTAQATAIGLKINTAAKDASGGVPGLTLFKLNLRNAANTITSWFTNAATVARTWTMPDKDGTVAMTSDITGGTSAGSFTTLAASGNVTLGDAATDTLNIGAGGIIKDASGNVGVGRNPSYALDVYKSGTVNSAIAAANDSVVAVMQTVTNIQANYGAITSHPVVFIQGNAEAARIDVNKNLLVTTPALLGYGAGAGGTVTQATNKSTAVTINKPCGTITLHNGPLTAGSVAIVPVNNSLVSANDVQTVSVIGGVASSTSYQLRTFGGVAGTFYILVENTTAGSLSEAVVISFAVHKVVTS